MNRLVPSNHLKVILVTLLLASACCTSPTMAALESRRSVMSTGFINYFPIVDVFINTSKLIGFNNLSVGCMLSHDWAGWKGSLAQRELTKNAGFKIIRLFSILIEPCSSWSESTKTGTFNWATVDQLVQEIFAVGAEPLICLGYWSSAKNRLIVPSGMAIDPLTDLPSPESYAAYCSEWVKHFKAVSLPVRFYEIVNEPWSYFGRYPVNFTKLGYYEQFFGVVAEKMRYENPSVMISHDASTIKDVLDHWLLYGPDLDFLDFHFYAASSLPGPSDDELFARAEQRRFEDATDHYGVDTARRLWFERRGKYLPVINSESNLNAACADGTDPRIQQMTGAVWTALVLRMGVLKGLSYNVYYHFASSASRERQLSSGGLGFGMVNSDDNKPYYPYYVYKWFGNNLAVGDLIVESSASSEGFRTLAWLHDGILNVLIISKVRSTNTVVLHGLSGQLAYQKIEDPANVSYFDPIIQMGNMSATNPMVINGYAILLLQSISP